MKKHTLSPGAIVARVLLGILYVWLSCGLLFSALPVWLREDNTVTNVLGLLAVICWFLVSLYLVLVWRSRQTKRKRNKR